MSVMIKLSITHSDGTHETRELDSYGQCLVGRADDCDIRLPNNRIHSDVSRHHCLFEVDPPHIRVRDLGSRNGTLVNDEMIGRRRKGQEPEEAHAEVQGSRELRDGDIVRVGLTVIQVNIHVPHWVTSPLRSV
jgi:eukaryotic-like serine/threonine-protein kinase